jgi:hypothetical protein
MMRLTSFILSLFLLSTVVSAQTTIPPATTLVCPAGSNWTIPGGVVQLNGKNAGFSANVKNGACVGGNVFYQITAAGCWSWNGTGWSSQTSCPTIPPPSSSSSSSSGSSSGGSSSGGSTITYTATLNWLAPVYDIAGNPIATTAADAITGYNIYMGATASTQLKIASVASTVTSYTITTIPAGPAFFTVTAVNAKGESAIASGTASAPGPVINLSISLGIAPSAN